MAKYIVLVNWTDQGIKNVKNSPSRVAAVREVGKTFGCDMTELYMTIGPYDLVTMVEAPDDESLAKYILTIAQGGNVRTTTLKAFDEDGYRAIIGGL